MKNAFSSAARAVTSFGKILGRGLADKAKQAVSGLKGLGKSSNKVSQSILKLSNMFKLMLIRMAMRAAIQGVKEGMQNLVQYSDSANQSMSGLMSNMTYLKNSFAAAFAPILSVVAPVLNTLINLLATAVGYINQFFSAHTSGLKRPMKIMRPALKKREGPQAKLERTQRKLWRHSMNLCKYSSRARILPVVGEAEPAHLICLRQLGLTKGSVILQTS